MVWPCQGEKALVLVHDVGDGRRCSQPFTREPLKIQQRPFARFQPFGPAVEQPEDDSVGPRTDARPDPLRDVLRRRIHRLVTAIDVVATLQLRDPVWLRFNAAAYKIIEVRNAESV